MQGAEAEGRGNCPELQSRIPNVIGAVVSSSPAGIAGQAEIESEPFVASLVVWEGSRRL